MNISISSIQLTNFKCFRNLELKFQNDITTIRGRNGVGKTTIADAILWCLFGKNTQGQSDFDLKTHDEEGKPIPNLDHSVEITLNCDHGFITLKRTLKETWVKKRGSSEQVFKNNTTEYMINGEVITATDYKKYISELVSEDIFRAITNPSYFPSLKWQEQRAFLANMVGTISSEDICGSDDELISLSNHEEDIVAYRKHLSYQIKQVKDKLNKIPVRLEEQNKALPEKLDWAALVVESVDVSRQLQEVNDKILAIRSGNGSDIKKDSIRKEIDALKKKSFDIEETHRKSVSEQRISQDEKISAATRKFNNLLNTQRDLESAIQSFTVLITRCRETAEKTFKSEQSYIREHWKETQEDFNNTDNRFCPICHQELPPDMENAAREKFNINKAELKKQLTERAAAAKQLLAAAEEEAKDLEAKKDEAEGNLKTTKEAINEAFSEKQQLQKEQLPTYEDVLADDPSYWEILEKINNLQQELQNVSTEDNEELLTSLNEQSNEYQGKLAEINAQLSAKTQYARIMLLIQGIEEEQQNLIKQLSDLEREEDIARRYQDRQNQILEARINEHFSIVKWKMFRTVNNNGEPFDEPYCECYVDGVAYHDGLNQAARLNAGLDIINALCKHYDVTAPIVIDNSESNLNILQTNSQQIRLEVFNSDLQLV